MPPLPASTPLRAEWQQHSSRGLLVSVAVSKLTHPGSGSAFSGRPPFIHNTSDVAQQAQWLVSLPSSLPNDRRLVASFEYEMIIRESSLSTLIHTITILLDGYDRFLDHFD